MNNILFSGEIITIVFQANLKLTNEVFDPHKP